MKKNEYIAVDIGGSKIFAMRAGKDGIMLNKITLPTEADKGRKKVIHNLISTINAVKSPNTVAVGIAWAGLVNSQKGIISKAPNIPGFENFNIKKILENKTSLPISIENDARLFALGEAKFGKKKQFNNLLGIIIGTGIGSGMVINGQLLTGHDGFAGEIGHVIFDKEKNLEVEEVFCAEAIKKYLRKNKLPLPIEKSLDLWQINNPQAKQYLNLFLDKFAIWISNLILTFNPEIIILGGGIGSRIFPVFIPYITKKCQNNLQQRGFDHTVNIQSSKLENAGALGALRLAEQNNPNI